MSTNSLFELLTVYTEVPESVLATSLAFRARSKACMGSGVEAETESEGVEKEAKEAEAVRRVWSRRAENWEKWCWRKEEMAAMGFGGGGEAPEVESEAEVEETIGAVERGKEDGAVAPGISSSCSTVFQLLDASV